MDKCTVSQRASDALTVPATKNTLMLAFLLIAVDACVCTALSYIALHPAYTRDHPSLLVQNSSVFVWSQLIFFSVLAAGVFRKTDDFLEIHYDNSGADAKIPSVLSSAVCAGTILVAVAWITDATADPARRWWLVWAVLFLAWILFSRLFRLAYRRHLSVRGSPKQKIAIIGARDCLTRLAALLAKDLCVTTVIDHSTVSGHALAEGLATVIALARDGVISLVVLATDEIDPPRAFVDIIERLKAAPVRVALCNAPSSSELFGLAGFVSVGGIPMRLLADRPLTPRDMHVKMLVDKLGALLLLLLVLPLLLAIAMAILLDTGGPIIFQQPRNGWCGSLFTVLKFRTMRHAPGQHLLHQTLRGDPRCTRVGLLLRRTSLDELPQLWNVLRGDMSLVGPRPHADSMHASERVNCGTMADYVQRQRVKPGLTGWAQVHGLRGAIDTPEKLTQRVEYDRYYIENWSFWLDLKILAKTPWAVLSRENAF